MNRVEFMTELASLLQDVPVEERREAMRYYNDYFDEAGRENEAQAISDLGSPAKVAEKIKEDLKGTEQEAFAGEKNSQMEGGPQGPVPQGAPRPGAAASDSTDGKILKVVLIILAIVVGAPIVLPVIGGILGLVLGILATVFGVFIALVLVFVALAVTGAALVWAGIVSLVPEIAVGLALIGTGLILGVIGVIGTVACVKLCMVVFPALCRGIGNLCKKPFHRKAVG